MYPARKFHQMFSRTPILPSYLQATAAPPQALHPNIIIPDRVSLDRPRRTPTAANQQQYQTFNQASENEDQLSDLLSQSSEKDDPAVAGVVCTVVGLLLFAAGSITLTMTPLYECQPKYEKWQDLMAAMIGTGVGLMVFPGFYCWIIALKNRNGFFAGLLGGLVFGCVVFVWVMIGMTLAQCTDQKLVRGWVG